jgi:hypothetical protein
MVMNLKNHPDTQFRDLVWFLIPNPTLVQRGRVLLLEGMAKSSYGAQVPKP